MRTALSRSVAAGVALATVLPAGVASAATSLDCRPETSVKAFTSGPDHVWVDRQSTTRVLVCVAIRSQPVGGLAVVADALAGATLPEVDVTNDPEVCPVVVRSISDPADVEIAVNLVTSAVCLTVEGSTLSIQFVPGDGEPGAPPVVEIWRDGGAEPGWIDIAACPVDFALFALLGVPTTCMSTNERIYP